MGETKNHVLLPLILSIACFSLFIPQSLSSTSPDDISVMTKLANSLSPTPSGWTGTDPCAPKWPGVNCNADRVVSINLPSKSLTGTLPSDLNKLSALQTLSLQNNQISGPLPSLANLTNLQEIYLDVNSFTSLPPSFFQGLTSLQSVTLNQNPLNPWSIPQDLAESTSLTTFYASNANVMGTIPDFFGTLPNFQSLRLSYNNLTGGLPSSFASSAIQNLWLNNQGSSSMLSGPITVLGSMAQISQVWLQSNAFTGPIPDLSKCASLFDLQLRDNSLTGMLPASITSLPKLVNVSLDNNKLQGPYPNFPNGVEAGIGTRNSFCNAVPGPCDDRVTNLLLVAEGFGYPIELANVWTGNVPCGWLHVTCDSQKVITGIIFTNQQLVGTISPAIANITTLRNINLSNNNITGTIPESLTKLSLLQTLDVSNNNLTGKIPDFREDVILKTSGNPFLGANLTSGGGAGSPGSSSDGSGAPSTGGSNFGTKSSSVNVGLIAGIVSFVMIFVGVAACIYYRMCFKRPHQKLNQLESPPNGSELKMSIGGLNGNRFTTSELHSQSSSEKASDIQMVEPGSMIIPIQVLRQVTNNFSEDNELGRGGFGVVYKGELHDGTQIAVKRMESTVMGNKGRNEFQAEIAVLTKVRHRHLVALLGYCVDGNERLLVYEYMPQGTLGQHLFDRGENEYAVLSWKQRLTIALDVARGIEYLHTLAQKSFIHRDLKPSNILLGDDLRAKVSDFGLVKLAPDGKYSVETRLAGTFGYLAPEYATTGRVTTKVDVYAFGVVLMELITGRKALDESLPEEHTHLVTYFRRILINKDNIRKAVDPSLDPDDEETYTSICTVSELAGHCTAREAHQRPDMGHAVNVLSPLVEQWKPTTRDEEDNYGIDLHMSLPQALERWQANEGSSTMGEDLYGRTRTFGNSQSSLPSKPSGIMDSFGSMDCR